MSELDNKLDKIVRNTPTISRPGQKAEIKQAIKEEVQRQLDIAWSAYKQGISWYPIGGEIKFLKAREREE